jgi:hypothetical protein
MVLHRPVETAHIIGKFDGSGESGSIGRGRSQALESKVRFADNSAIILLLIVGCTIEASLRRT